MTEPIVDQSAANIATVEKFLNSLRDKDLDTADSLLAGDLVYQNVGFPTIRGRQRAMKLLAGLQRPSFGFDVKVHRTAADGDTTSTTSTSRRRSCAALPAVVVPSLQRKF